MLCSVTYNYPDSRSGEWVTIDGSIGLFVQLSVRYSEEECWQEVPVWQHGGGHASHGWDDWQRDDHGEWSTTGSDYMVYKDKLYHNLFWDTLFLFIDKLMTNDRIVRTN